MRDLKHLDNKIILWIVDRSVLTNFSVIPKYQTTVFSQLFPYMFGKSIKIVKFLYFYI